MSNVSDIEASTPLAKASFSRYDRIDVDSLVALDGLIALSQIYQYRSEYAAIRADDDCISETSFCCQRIIAVADRMCQIYKTLPDKVSCILALEHLRTIEYGYGLDHLKLFVDRQADLLRRSARLSDSARLMLAIICGDDYGRILNYAEQCYELKPDYFAARALLTAAAIVPDRIRIENVTEWFEHEAQRLTQQPSLTANDLRLISLAPLLWNAAPALHPAVESLATLNPRADLTADMTLTAHRAFLALTSLIASITAA